MHHRDGIRPRPIDDHKQYMIIKDLAEAKKGGDKEKIDKINDIEKELYNIIEYYDKIKKNQIPKAKIINEKNDKNEINVNYNINNNIIYTIEKNEEPNQNNSQYVLNIKLSEYKRSDSYIIYSSKKQDELNSKRKIYEATEADKIYLNIRHNVMSLEELENIIIDLENSCTNEKDDKINEESAKKIIETKYSKYISLADSIINHFKDRRTSIKKSLIRKKWHKNKSSDKFLTNTFKKRTGDKRQTRKSNQNKEESLNKIIEAQNYCKSNLLAITNDMKIREDWNREKLKLEECIFLTEIEKLKDIKIVPAARIKENNYIKEKIEKNIKIIKEKENIRINADNEAKSNINHKNANKLLLNEISINSTEYKNKNNLNNIQNTNIINNEDQAFSNKSNISDTKSVNSINLDNSINSIKKGNEKKIINNKNQSKNKNNEIFPNVSLNCLKENDLSLKEENDTNENNNKNNKKNKMRMRIRINRNSQIVIDRYIQNDNGFDPFADNYNDVFTNYRNYEINELEYLNNNNFEKLYHSYNLNKLNNLNIFYESDDEDVNADIKQFSNSFKQFLKNKRAQIK